MNPPTQMAINAGTHTLTLRWSDGREQRIAHAQLRRVCPCAECRRIRLDGGTVQAPPDLILVAVQPMGYGVQLVFGDGHARGIYPWRYLEQMAQAGSPYDTSALAYPKDSEGCATGRKESHKSR